MPRSRYACFHQLHHGRKLFLDLVRRAENMGVVQRHAAHPAEPAQRSRALIAIHRAEFGDTDGKVAVAALLGLVDQDVVRAVHGPQHHLFGLEIHGREHAVLVMIPVARALIELDLGQIRSIDMLVSGGPFALQNVVFEQPANGGAFRQPQRQPCPDHVADGEEFQFFARACDGRGAGLPPAGSGNLQGPSS